MDIPQQLPINDQTTFLWLTKEELIAAGMIVCIVFALTELIKRGVWRVTGRFDDYIPRVIAVALGFGLTYYTWPATSAIDPLLAGSFLSLMAPVMYPVIVSRFKK